MPKSKRLRQVGKSRKRSPGQRPGRRTGTEPAARNHLGSNSGGPGTEARTEDRDAATPWQDRSHYKPGSPNSAKDQQHWGFPCGSAVKNLPADAGVTGSVPVLRRSRMPWRNQVCAPATEPMIYSLCPTTREASAMGSPHTATKSRPPLTTTRESQLSNKDAARPKNNKELQCF